MGNEQVDIAWWLQGTAEQFRITGRAYIVPAPEHTLLGHLGPDIMADDWATRSAEAVRRMSQDPARPVGAALLDQTNVAGITPKQFFKV